MAAVDLAQEAQQSGDVGSTVLVEAVQAHEGVQEQQRGAHLGQRLVQSALVAFGVEAQAGSGDDVQVEARKRDVSVLTQLRDAVADAGQGILGEIHDGRSGGVDREAPESRRAGRHRDGQIKAEP